MKTYILGLAGLTAACAPQYAETRLAPGAPLPVSEARFVQEPDLLHQAFRDSCQGPRDAYTAIQSGARCQMVPTAEIAASLIARYDGALEIPRIVVERRTRNDGDGYVVSFSYFASVVQKSGAEQRVYLQSQRLDRTIDEMFRAFGGQPI